MGRARFTIYDRSESYPKGDAFGLFVVSDGLILSRCCDFNLAPSYLNTKSELQFQRIMNICGDGQQTAYDDDPSPPTSSASFLS